LATVTTAITTELDAAAWPDRHRAWAALALLMATAIVSQLDRAVINLLIEPIQAEYGLSDTQFGALQSIAFGAFYVVMAIPLGILADRYQRRAVIGIGIGVFSLFSLGTGLARNYTQLFIARMGVGVGEASVTPAGFSLISDLFPPEKLGRAISFFTMSNFIGTSLAYVVGGALLGWFDQMHAARSEALYGAQPWQLTIMCIALPGLLLAPCFLLLQEPSRRGLTGQRQRVGFMDLMRELGKRRSFLILMIAGMAMASTMTYAVSMWTPALFIRVYGWSAPQIGAWLGILVLVGGVVGSYLAGWITDVLTQRSKLAAPINVAAISAIGVGLFGVAAPLMPTPIMSLLCFVPVMFLKPMAFACIPVALQMVMPNQLRAQVSATYLTIINLVGLGLGPLVVGLMTDHVFTVPGGLRYSMSVITAITVPLMIVMLLLSRGPYRALRLADS
jgi:MFS family permease